MDNRYNILFLLCQETWNCRQSREGTRIGILWEMTIRRHFYRMTIMQQKMEIKSISVVALVGVNTQRAAWKRSWRGVCGSPAALAVENSHCTSLQKERAS